MLVRPTTASTTVMFGVSVSRPFRGRETRLRAIQTIVSVSANHHAEFWTSPTSPTTVSRLNTSAEAITTKRQPVSCPRYRAACPLGR